MADDKPSTAPDNCIVFVHSNNALDRYDYLLKYKNIVLVCSTNHSKQELIAKGHRQVIYVPLSIDTEYLAKFKSETKSGTIACGNVWAFTSDTKNYFRSKGIPHYHDLQRDELLALMGQSERVYAIGRTAMEAIYLGAEVIQPEKEYPVEKYTTYYTQDDAIKMMQEQLDNLEEVVTPIKDVKVVVGMATMNTRRISLRRTLESISKQIRKPDSIYVYNNDENPFNATDNAKFYYLETDEYKKDLKSDVDTYFLTMDDDIVYPETYIEDMIKAIKENQCIVTFHGRQVNSFNTSYYRGKFEYFDFRNPLNEDKIIEIPGTGVMGFDIKYFCPNIFKDDRKRMSDILVGHKAINEGKKIVCLKRKDSYFKEYTSMQADSCAMVERRNDSVQTELANEIYNKKTKI